MAVPISRSTILQNLSKLRDYVSNHPPDRRLGHIRIYKCLMNFSSGDLRFAQKISSLEHRMAHKNKMNFGDWEEIEISVEQKGNRLHFKIDSVSPKIGKLAQQIIDETFMAINQIAKIANNQRIDLDLSRLQFSLEESGIELLAGWKGGLDRIEAELQLKNKAVGSYLLREVLDETQEMVELLAKSNNMQIKGYLCTVKEPEEKITDLLILQSNLGWTLRLDSQDLNDRAIYFYTRSLQELIGSLSSRLLYPV